jgi:DNA-binding CsgD family transcriptional regulator
MKIWFYISLILVPLFLLRAQNAEIDSLIRAKAYTEALKKVDHLLEIRSGDEVLWYQKARALHYKGALKEAIPVYLKALSLADDSDFPDLSFMAECTNALSGCYGELGLYNKAIECQKRALTFAEKAGVSTLVADGKFALCTYYTRVGQYDSALIMIRQVYEMDLKTGDSSNLSSDFNSLAFLYGQKKEYQKALEYYQKSVDYLKPDQYRSLAIRYSNMAMAHMELEAFNEAEKWHVKSYQLYEQIQDSIKMAQQKVNMGVLYMRMNQYPLAERYMREAVDFYEQLGNDWALSRTRIQLSRLLSKSRRQGAALNEINAAIKFFDSKNYLADLVESYKLKVEIEEGRGNTAGALETLKTYNYFSDSLNKNRQLEEVNNLELQFVTAQKEQEIKLLELQNELQNASLLRQKRENLALILGLTAVLFFGIFLFISQRQKHRINAKLLSREIDALRLQLSTVLGEASGRLETSKENIDEKLETPLSQREYEILQLAMTDKSNREIADDIHISVNTVKYHLKNIYEKIGVSSRKEALRFILND